MNVRGTHGTSLDIMKEIQKSREVNNPQVNESPAGGGSSLRMPGGSEGGASFTMMKRKKEAERAEKAVNETKPVVEEKVVTLDTHITEEVLVEWVQENSTRSADVIKPLYNLYKMGLLDGYEITGLDKKEVLNILEDFCDTVKRVVM